MTNSVSSANLTVSLSGSGLEGRRGRARLSPDSITRFWSKVEKTPGGCWLWAGSRTGSRMQHGQVTIRSLHGCPVKAHRVAWLLTHGDIPDNFCVCHRCDVPLCVNPDHLFLGTQKDNLQDASRKGRLRVSRSRRLTLAERLAIYHAPRDRGTGAELARQYGVSKVVIHHCRKGRFVGAPALNQHDPEVVLERVPHVQVPVRGDLHLGQSHASTVSLTRQLGGESFRLELRS
jgi:hypothetical protein